MPEDYYQTLELARGASLGDIKHAYRRLARRYHPDLHPDDPSAEERMEGINRAYEVLSDAARREEYDRYQRKSEPEAERAEPKQTYEQAAGSAAAYERMSPYEILNVSPTASHRDIREAFSRLVATFGEAAISDPAAALAFQHMKSAYSLLSTYERRRGYNAAHRLPEPPHPDEEAMDRPLGVLDGLGDLVWIAPVAFVVLFFLVFLLWAFKPYWL